MTAHYDWGSKGGSCCTLARAPWSTSVNHSGGFPRLCQLNLTPVAAPPSVESGIVGGVRCTCTGPQDKSVGSLTLVGMTRWGVSRGVEGPGPCRKPTRHDLRHWSIFRVTRARWQLLGNLIIFHLLHGHGGSRSRPAILCVVWPLAELACA